MSLSLLLLNGPRPGATLRLDDSRCEVTLGRDPARDLQLDDDRASRLHARILRRGAVWQLEDCGSTNGTVVNSLPVEQALLEPGDLIRIGERLILVVEDSPESSTPCDFTGANSPTLHGALPANSPREQIVSRELRASMFRVVRDSTVLCRLAGQLHERRDAGSLFRVTIEALLDGMRAQSASIWLTTTDGSLALTAQRGAAKSADTPNDLVCAVAERNAPKMMGDLCHAAVEESIDKTVRSGRVSGGHALAVPIPSGASCRGVIECHRLSGAEPFTRADQDFAIVVAHQAGLALENLEHRQRLELANRELRQRLSGQTRLVGSSHDMQEVHEQIACVGPTDATVLILGESGTGKELVAQLLHEASSRRAGPYVALNCAAFAESLLESELFGHEAGAFTGADRRHIGQLERAHRGTIFLDEVGELSPACQAKLLRVLEGQPFQRVGGRESVQVDLRVLAATHRDLTELVQQGRFRADLYYRLRVIDFHLPPLREREDDVIELAVLFLDQFRRQLGRSPKRFSAGALAALREHTWPGNVRELRNAIERAAVLGRGEELTAAELGLMSGGTRDGLAASPLMSLEAAERRHIERVLRAVGGNKTEACRILKIGRATLYAKLNEPVEPLA